MLSGLEHLGLDVAESAIHRTVDMIVARVQIHFGALHKGQARIRSNGVVARKGLSSASTRFNASSASMRMKFGVCGKKVEYTMPLVRVMGFVRYVCMCVAGCQFLVGC